MVNGFEEETAPLGEEEERMLPVVADALRYANGRDRAVTNGQIARRLGLKPGNEWSGGRVRKMVHAVRARGLVQCVVATSRGYHVAESRAEALEYVESLKQRISAIAEVARSIEKQAAERFGSQEELDIF